MSRRDYEWQALVTAPNEGERTEAIRSIMLVAELSEEMAEAILCDLIFLGWTVEPAPTNGRSEEAEAISEALTTTRTPTVTKGMRDAIYPPSNGSCMP